MSIDDVEAVNLGLGLVYRALYMGHKVLALG